MQTYALGQTGMLARLTGHPGDRRMTQERLMVPRTLREEVARAHHRLAAAGLVTLSFGNASGRDRESGAIVIKPSGIACDALAPDDLVVIALDGTVLEGTLRPSSDTPTHLEL